MTRSRASRAMRARHRRTPSTGSCATTSSAPRPLRPRLGARIQVVEVPPGLPVLQTLVAEVYGPDPKRRLALAQTVRSTFERTAGVVDVDWYVESSQPKLRLE